MHRGLVGRAGGAMARVTRRRRVRVLHADGRVVERPDALAGEEPLEIRVDGRPFSVTMRTPGHDFELVAGFLVAEGVVRDAAQIAKLQYGPGVDADGLATYNIVDVTLAAGVAPPEPAQDRHVYTSSSCGICGTASIEAVTKASAFGALPAPEPVPLAVLLALPDALRAGQRTFQDTGGTHAAGLFASDGSLLCLREDVGRHNAVDKVVGWALLDGRLPLTGTILQVSGRASFELVQKAYLAGIGTLAAVSAPSALAADLAEDVGLTLIGFSRGNRLTQYTGPPEAVGGLAP